MHTPSANQQGFVVSLIAFGVARLANRLPAISNALAVAVMGDVANDVCAAFGRAEVYIPARLAPKRHERDVLIRAKYFEPGPDGTQCQSTARAAQLAREHGLSVRQVRTILAAMRPRTANEPTKG